jgi:hypothetical protein
MPTFTISAWQEAKALEGWVVNPLILTEDGGPNEGQRCLQITARNTVGSRRQDDRSNPVRM